MKSFAIISLLFIASWPAKAQSFNSIDTLLIAFYDAISTDDLNERQAKLNALFVDKGKISSVNQENAANPRIISGTVESFIQGSKDLYNQFKISNDEVSREVEYFGEIASIHGLSYQTLTKKTSGTKYTQYYWMQLELAYIKDRWFIAYASWTNKFKGIPVQNALLTDTIWHQP